MRLVFRARLPEARLRAALRRAAAGAAAAITAPAEAGQHETLGRLPGTSMLAAALRRRPSGEGTGVDDSKVAKD